MKLFTVLLLAFGALTLEGCNRVANSIDGPVAVLDLDAVAQRVGKDKQMLQMVEQRQVSLNEQVLATQKSLIEQLNQKKVEYGELNDEEALQLKQLQNQANTILASTQTQAQSNLTMFQQEVVNRFRAEIKPIAMELASKKGCRVVLSKNESVVFAFDSTVDLTDAVVAQMQSQSPSSVTESKLTSTTIDVPVKQATAQANPKK